MARSRTNAGYDAIIIGAGPNGLSAGIVLAHGGYRTLIVERNTTIGGGARTIQLTRPGFLHDVCSAVHPLGIGSPFFRRLPLDRFGLEWIQPHVPAAHPLDNGDAVALRRSMIETSAALGPDCEAYLKLVGPYVASSDKLFKRVLAPLRPFPDVLFMARFGLHAARSAEFVASGAFNSARCRALFAGMAAHSMLRLDQLGTAGFGLTLMIAGHAYGWPFPRGGSQALANALAVYFESLGGEIQTNTEIRTMNDLPASRVYVFDTSPAQLVEIAGDRIAGMYRRQISRFRHGPGVFKLDYALSGPIPWRSGHCREAGTIHIGGTFAEIAGAERAVLAGHHPSKPFVLVSQPSLFDPTRAPDGYHTGWAYCHVPANSTVDMTAVVEQQIERFAPGFRSRILARNTMTGLDMQEYNPNYVGGDISGGSNQIRQIMARPVFSLNPYATSDPQIYVCSASTPPGGGVHGMAGYHAARSALRALRST